MYDSVATAFNQINDQIEGVVRWPYLDVKGLVTCAVGYLVDDGSGSAPANMLALPWKHIDGTPATNDEISAAWSAVKNSGLAGIGGGNQQFANLTDLRLDDAGIQQATDGWVAIAEPHLRSYFPNYDTMQADGQLGILLMAYALGSAFAPGYPKFTAAINALVPDYTTAAAESNISTVGNPGVAPRDADIVQLFTNAASAQSTNVANDVLWWPGTTPPSGGGNGPGGGGIGTIVASGGTWLGRILIGLTTGVFAFAGWQAFKHRDDLVPAGRRLVERVEKKVGIGT